MLSYFQSALVVMACVLTVLFVLWLLDRKLEALTRRRANGVNGWQLTILGTIYAVSLGFMLSDAWLAYQTATADVRKEADATATLAHLTAGLPVACQTDLQHAVSDYARVVVFQEWPTMAQGRPDWQGDQKLALLWHFSHRCGNQPMPETDRQLITGALEDLQSYRSARRQDYEGRLPELMWAVMLVGAVSVITSSCLLANEKRRIHSFHVVSLTILVSLMLLAIEDLDLPFQGATHVAPALATRVLPE